MANEYLKRTPTSTGNRKVFTWAGWVKRNTITGSYVLFSAGIQGDFVPGGNGFQITFDFDKIQLKGGNTQTDRVNTSALYRDTSSWFHLLFHIDTTKSIETDRYKLYINGVEYTGPYDSATPNWPALNFEYSTNFAVKPHTISANSGDPAAYMSCELTDIFFIDGQALTPEVFGYYKDGEGYISAGTSQATDFRNGKWTPKKPQLIIDEINESGGFGVNGFYLPMNSSNNFGADFHTKPNTILKLKDNLPQPKAEIDGSGDYSGDVREELGGLPFAGVVKFDGSGDYLEIPNDTDFDLGSEWTIEFWLYPITTQNGKLLGTRGDSSPRGWEIVYWNNQIGIEQYGDQSTGGQQRGSILLSAKKWHHISICFSGGVVKTYINGVLDLTYSGSSGSNWGSGGHVLRIGKPEPYEETPNVYLSNLRILKGTALYTENFTPPKYKLEKIPNTVLLCCNSKTDATNEETGKTITKNGDVYATTSEVTDALVLALPFVSGGLQNGFGDYSAAIRGYGSAKTINVNGGLSTSSDVNLYYGSSAFFNNGGTSGSQFINTSHSDYALGLQDFTLESWIYPTSLYNYWTLLSTRPSDGSFEDAYHIGIDSIASLGFYSNQYDAKSHSGVININQWSHVAAVRIGNTLTLYVNGVAVAINTNYTKNLTRSDLTIGRLQNLGSNLESATGYIQDLRIYKGIAKYKGGFDVPKPYTPVNFASWRALPDTSANNFATWNPLAAFDGSLTDGNLTITSNDSIATIGVKTGKWYWEARTEDPNTGDGSVHHLGWTFTNYNENATSGDAYSSPEGKINIRSDGTIQNTSGQTITILSTTGSAPALGTGDILGIELDLDSSVKTCKFYKNGIISLTVEFSYNERNFALPLNRANGLVQQSNFGQNPTFSGKIANVIRVNSSDSSWDQTPNTGSHNDWTISNEGRDLNVAVSAGFYARAYLYLDPNEKYLLSFDYISGPANLGILSDTSGYLRATDGSLSPNGLSAGNSYTFEISNSNWVNFTGFNSQTYDINNIYLTRVVPGYQDSNGKGEFRYQPPAGFLALCEDNLPRPTIDDPGKHFKTILYTGNDATRGITGVGFQPDLVWIKNRSLTYSNHLYDSVRGANRALYSDLSNAEFLDTDAVLSFDDDGFSVGGEQPLNRVENSIVAWCWKAGGPAVTNTAGTITSQVSANQTAGFSIVGWTGNGVNGATLGHGLNKRPSLIICKRRDAVQPWYVWVDSLTRTTANNGMTLNITSAVALFTFGHFTSLNESTSTLTQGTSDISNVNTSGATYIAYCWTEIEGFSKFGTYVGNDSTDGPFVYCGFKPALVILKASSTTGNWCMIDNARNPTNPTYLFSVANAANAGDDTGGLIDFVSNGFKLRLQSPNFNGNGVTYIFAAFAESPFQNANAK